MKTADLSENAYEIAKERLLDYEQGKYLSARSFSSEIGMSYTPVREAFIRLQKEGFLERVPNVGFFVVKLGIREILEIFQVRECIESFVFEKVFEAITDNEVSEMNALVNVQMDALVCKDIKQYIKADEQFHFIFFRIYGNKHFISLIKSIREQYMLCSNRIAKAGGTEGIKEHKQLIQCIANKDKEGAVSTIVNHIGNAKQRMKEGFINERNFYHEDKR